MNKRQLIEEERFYDICGWEWNEEREDYEIFTVAKFLTIDEAKEIFSKLIPDNNIPQYDLFFDDYYETREKVACRESVVDGVYEEWI